MRWKMQEKFYCEEIDIAVALFLTSHGCQIHTERVPPGHVFHCAVCPIARNGVRVGGGDNSPIYRYWLEDGAVFLAQTLRSRAIVPGHPNDYWSRLYIEDLSMDEIYKGINFDEPLLEE